MENNSIHNKVVLITGASSGIGEAVALEAAKSGAKVIVSAGSEENLKLLVEKLSEYNSKSIYIVADVTKADQIENLFNQAKELYGQIDVVFDNAGMGFAKRLEEITNHEIEQTIDVNVKGMIWVAKETAKIFAQQKSGHIILTASIAGLVTLPKWSVYVASKWAITAFADCIRPEFKEFNAKVTTIHPGMVKTDFFARGNFDEKELRKMMPVEYVAEQICNVMLTNKERVILPKKYVILADFYRIFPRLAKFLTSKIK